MNRLRFSGGLTVLSMVTTMAFSYVDLLGMQPITSLGFFAIINGVFVMFAWPNFLRTEKMEEAVWEASARADAAESLRQPLVFGKLRYALKAERKKRNGCRLLILPAMTTALEMLFIYCIRSFLVLSSARHWSTLHAVLVVVHFVLRSCVTWVRKSQYATENMHLPGIFSAVVGLYFMFFDAEDVPQQQARIRETYFPEPISCLDDGIPYAVGAGVFLTVCQTFITTSIEADISKSGYMVSSSASFVSVGVLLLCLAAVHEDVYAEFAMELQCVLRWMVLLSVGCASAVVYTCVFPYERLSLSTKNLAHSTQIAGYMLAVYMQFDITPSAMQILGGATVICSSLGTRKGEGDEDESKGPSPNFMGVDYHWNFDCDGGMDMRPV